VEFNGASQHSEAIVPYFGRSSFLTFHQHHCHSGQGYVFS